MKSSSRWRVGVVAVAGACSVGCGGSEPGEMMPPTTGSLRVSTATTGEDVDADGYQVRVGSDAQPVGVNASVIFADLAAGAHAVTLEGLSSNCTTSNNPRSVSVTVGSEASTSFSVECEALRTSEVAAQEASDSLGSALFRIINDLEDVSSLDGFTFEPAQALYQEALTLDPDNRSAAFGLAITTIFALEDHPDLRAAADAWEAWLDAHDVDELNGVRALGTPGPVLWRRASLPLDPTGAALGGLVTDGRMIRALIVTEAGSTQQDFPPTPAEHQALLRTIVEPALVEALALLYQIEDPAFTFEVTPAMQGESEGEADPLELDRTEVLVLQAGIEAALAGLDVATAYVAEPSPWGADGFAEAMEQGSTFATLAADGSTRLADAHDRLGRAVGLLHDALDVLVAETDDQDDDVIKYDPGASGGGYDDLDDYVGNADVADARELLDELEGSLAGPTVLTVDLGQGEVDLEVDLTELFLDPIPDLKALLPDYDASGGRFRWTAATFEEWVFPDPTLGGVLPGMGSTDDLKDAMDLQEIYEEYSSGPGGENPLAARRSIATGGDHTCALGEQGQVFCWGGGHSFVLGDGDLADSPYPIPVLGARTFVEVASGGDHACALTIQGTVYCWGSNGAGQLGLGTREDRFEPTEVAGGITLVSITAGGAHTCGLDTDRRAWCWGLNDGGQIGSGTTGTEHLLPEPVVGGHRFTQLEAGPGSTCGVTVDGVGLCWGRNEAGQLGNGSTVPTDKPREVSGGITFDRIAVHAEHACGLNGSGEAFCWGDNQYGQLGNGSTSSSSTPVSVAAGMPFATLSVGYLRTCGTDADGGLHCWGSRLETDDFDAVPRSVAMPTPSHSVSVGWWHTCVLTSAGAAHCWGDNDFGKLGDGTELDRVAPVPVLGRIRFATRPVDQPLVIPSFEVDGLGLGLWHSCAVRTDGIVYCWGDGDFGQLGAGFSRNSGVPLPVSLSSPVVDVDAGGIFSCAVTAPGDAYCWGDGRYGRLGDGTTNGSDRPVLVGGGHSFVTIGTGARHACGLTPEGSAYCWGNNSLGQLGIGTTGGPETCTGHLVCSSVPVRVSGGVTFTSLTVGSFHNCGTAADEVTYCWGHNFHGQLGLGTADGPENCQSFGSSTPGYCSTSPIPVSGGLTFASISAAYGDHTCGVATQGEGYCWGDNARGKLGDGTDSDRSAPTLLAGGLRWSGIVGGRLHSCGLTLDGSAYCWGGVQGLNLIGNAGIEASLTPVPVTSSHLFEILDVGRGHTCGMSSGNGRLYCWGENNLGQVGDGVTAWGINPLPMPVWGLGLPDLR